MKFVFAKNLRKLMDRRQVNQMELSRISGVDQSLISSYLSGGKKAKTPHIKNLAALAKALKCSMEELIGLKKIK